MVPTKFTPALFVLAMVCFALPFAQISCQGQAVTTLTGIQAMTGTSVEGAGQHQDIPGDAMAIAAFLAGLAGAILAFKGPRQFAGFAGIAGVILLLVFKSRLESKIAAEGQGAFLVQFAVGFWLAMLSLAVGAALSFTATPKSALVAPPESPAQV